MVLSMYGRLLVLILALVLSPCSWAQTPLRLTSEMERVDLVPHTAWLRDATGTMTVDQASASTNWHPLPGSFNVGFTHEAIWLRIQIDRPDTAPRNWLVEIGNGVLADLRLYERAGTGTWREHQAGTDIPRSNWDLDYRAPVFHLDLTEPGRHTVWLRVRTRTSLSAQVLLWRPQRFEAGSRRESLAYGLLFGAYATIFIFHLFFWHWSREEVSRWYAWYVSNSLGQMVLTFGHLQQYVSIPGWISDITLALLICSSIWVGVNMCVQFLGLPTHMPRVARCLTRSAALLSMLFSLLALGVNYATGVAPAQLSVFVLIFVLVAVALRLCWQGQRQAGFFLLAFGIFFAGIILRILRNFTLLPPNFLTDNGYQIGAVAHMVVMSLAITERYNGMKQEKVHAQAEALQAKTEYASSLESEVAARTGSLINEIGRREAVEDELRQALAAERQARQEQRDFVAMVSHEFRTPLSIIDTSTQRIAGSPATPEATLERCRNIRQAAQRMISLMDDFFSFDHIDSDLRSVVLTHVDPEHMIRSAAGEWDRGHISVACRNLPTHLPCDADLLRIALRNLLANAIRHSPEGVRVKLSAYSHDNDIVIEVADHGSGIPSDEMPKLFQKYFRGRGAKDKPGTGLGLYLVKRIVELHGGHVTAHSELHSGTTFVISLPHHTSRLPSDQ